MSFSHGKTHSNTAKKEQIFTEVFSKSLHIILESRAPHLSTSRNSSVEQNVSSPSSSSSSCHKPRDRWFNLALTECQASLENIDFWRQSILDPMIIDVILIKRVFKPDLEKSEGFHETITEKIIERWVVQYEIRETKDSSSRSERSCGSLHTFYKNLVLLLRSLYTTVRILPIYKLFRELSSSDHMRNCTLIHRVNTFVEPFTREEEAEMHKFCFTPVDTSTGSLYISVLYHDISHSDPNFEPLAPSSLLFIPDYVGSPIVDPIKRLSSIPVSQSLPSYASFTRHPPSVSPSLSPTHPDSQASVLKLRSRLPPMILSHCMQHSHLQLPSPQVKSMKPGEKTEKSLGGSVREKKFSLESDESARFLRPRISSISPRVPFSNRVSFQGDFDDADFCHFAVNGDGMTSPDIRPASSDQRKQPSDPFEPYGSSTPMKSQEAAMGALILMLNRAPSLQYDCTNSTFPPLATSKPDGSRCTGRAQEFNFSKTKQRAISTFSPLATSKPDGIYQISTKTAADALVELRSFSEAKERRLRQGSVAKPQISKSDILS